MPLTLAHPAAAILVHRAVRRRLPLSALVVGSVTPDVVYFLPLGVSRFQTHTHHSLLWFSLPVGLLLYVIYWRVLYPAILASTPPRVRISVSIQHSDRLVPISIATVALAIVTGAATHVTWDSFTHANGFFVRSIPILQQVWLAVGSYEVSTFKLAQHFSSLFGVAFLVGVAWKTNKTHATSEAAACTVNGPWKKNVACIFVTCTLSVLTTLYRADTTPQDSIELLQVATRSVIIGTTSGIIVALVLIRAALRSSQSGVGN